MHQQLRIQPTGSSGNEEGISDHFWCLVQELKVIYFVGEVGGVAGGGCDASNEAPFGRFR
jgi:hypothetical protein